MPNSGFMQLKSPSSLTEQIRPSSSCPSDVARLKKLQGLHLTDEEIRLIVKDRQKKDNHNMS